MKRPNPTARLWHLLNGSSATVTFSDGVQVKMGIIEAAEFMRTLREEGWEIVDRPGVEQEPRG